MFIFLSKLLYLLIGSALGKTDYDAPYLDIQVQCVSNCDPTYVEYPLHLNVVCELCLDKYSFKWSIAPFLGYFNFSRDTTTSHRGKRLVVNNHVYKPLDNISFMAITEGQSGEKEFFYISKPKTFAIVCVSNCPVADYKVNVVYRVNCDPNCHGVKFKWSFYPHKSGHNNELVEIKNNNQMVIFRTGTFVDKFKFTIELRADEHYLSTELWTSEEKATSRIMCANNCDKDFLIDEEFVLYVLANDFVKLGITPQWSITPSPSAENWQQGLMTMPEDIVSYLYLEPGSFLGGLEVHVEVKMGEGIKSTYNFKTKGFCKVTPPFGYAGITEFKLLCSYVIGTVIKLFQKETMESNDFGILIYKDIVLGLNSTKLWLAPGNPTYVMLVIDKFEHFFLQKLQISVSGLVQESEMPTELNIISHYSGSKFNNDSFVKAIKSRNYFKVVQMAAIFEGKLKLVDQKINEHYRKHILEDLLTIVDGLPYEQTLSLALLYAKHTKTAVEAHIICNLVQEALSLIPQDTSFFVLQRVAIRVFDSFTYISNLQLLLRSYLNVPSFSEDDPEEYLNSESEQSSYLRASNLYHLKWLTFLIIECIESVAMSLGPYESVTIQSSVTNGIVLHEQRLKGSIIQAEGIQSYVLLSPEWSQLNDWFIQIINLKPNLFWWENTGQFLVSEIISIHIFTTDQAMVYLGNPLDVYIESNLTKTRNVQGVLQYDDDIVILKLNGQQGSTLFITFHHNRYDYYYYFSTQFPYKDQAKRNGHIIVRRNSTQVYLEFSHVYLVIYKLMYNVVLSYNLDIKQLRCIHWDEHRRRWTTRYCRLGKFSNSTHTHCQCVHLSIIAVSNDDLVHVPVQLSDMHMDEKPRPVELILGAMLVVIFLFTLFLVLAAIRDRTVNDWNVIKKPFDTIPGDKHLYLVSIETGGSSTGTTTSTVVLQIYGADGVKSRRHIISGSNKLERNGEDWYMVCTPHYLGKLVAVRLFHDMTGPKPDWYCRRITIKHIGTREVYYFEVHSWFSAVKGDGRIHRLIGASTWEKFMKKKIRSMFPILYREEALLLSFIFRPPQNTFTSKERVMIGLVQALVSMASTLVYLGVTDMIGWDSDQSMNLNILELSLIGKVLVVTVPLTALLTVMFKRAKPFNLTKI